MIVFHRPTRVQIIFLLSMLLILGGSGGVSYYFFRQYKEAKRLIQFPDEIAKREKEELVAKLGRHILLPQDEDPTIAEVLDKNKIKDPFFARAENGDKVIMYSKSGKVILYRLSLDKIINVGPVSLSSPSANMQLIRTALYNGSADPTILEKVKKDLAKITNLQLVSQGQAKQIYEKTEVVDLTGSKKDLAEQMAQFVKGAVSPLPAGETLPVASDGSQIDLLIIVGNNYGK